MRSERPSFELEFILKISNAYFALFCFVGFFFFSFLSFHTLRSQCWFWVFHYTKLSRTSELHIHTQILVPLLLFSIAIYVPSFVIFLLLLTIILLFIAYVLYIYKFVCITQFCRHFFCHTTANNNLRYGFG